MPRCTPSASIFGVNFEFEPGYNFTRKNNNLETFKRGGSYRPARSNSTAGHRHMAAAAAAASNNPSPVPGHVSPVHGDSASESDASAAAGPSPGAEAAAAASTADDGLMYGLISRIYFFY